MFERKIISDFDPLNALDIKIFLIMKEDNRKFLEFFFCDINGKSNYSIPIETDVCLWFSPNPLSKSSKPFCCKIII